MRANLSGVTAAAHGQLNVSHVVCFFFGQRRRIRITLYRVLPLRALGNLCVLRLAEFSRPDHALLG